MSYKINDRDLRELAKEMEADGWRLEQTSGNKVKWIPPGGDERHVVFTATTCKDHRAIENIRRDLRNALRLAGKYMPRPPVPVNKPLKAPLVAAFDKHAEEQKKFAEAQKEVALPPKPAEPKRMPEEKPVIPFAEACRLIEEEIVKHRVLPVVASRTVWELYLVESSVYDPLTGRTKGYSTPESLASRFVKEYPQYRSRRLEVNRPRPQSPLPQPSSLSKPAAIPPAVVTYPQGLPQAGGDLGAAVGLAEQLAHLAATPGLDEGKKKELISFFLKMQ